MLYLFIIIFGHAMEHAGSIFAVSVLFTNGCFTEEGRSTISKKSCSCLVDCELAAGCGESWENGKEVAFWVERITKRELVKAFSSLSFELRDLCVWSVWAKAPIPWPHTLPVYFKRRDLRIKEKVTAGQWCNRYCNSKLLLAYSLTDKYGRVFSLFQMFILIRSCTSDKKK